MSIISNCKKVVILLLLCISFCVSLDGVSAANCKYSGDFKGSLESCMRGTDLIQKDTDIERGFKTAIIDWTKSIAFYLGIAAVFAIVYASSMMTLSAGDDEKINKAKGILKWSIFGLLGVMFAAVIITLTINLIYGL